MKKFKEYLIEEKNTNIIVFTLKRALPKMVVYGKAKKANMGFRNISGENKQFELWYQFDQSTSNLSSTKKKLEKIFGKDLDSLRIK